MTKILSEKPIHMAQLREELEAIKKRDNELNFRANKTMEYLSQFSIPKNIDALVKKITELNIPRLKEQHTAKIVDLLPTNAEDLKIILQGYTITVNAAHMKQIVELVEEFLGKAKEK